jgi:hypothetical protein
LEGERVKGEERKRCREGERERDKGIERQMDEAGSARV